MSDRESTLRPLSHSSSTGNLRDQSNSNQHQHPRSATVANGFDRQADVTRTPSLKSNKSGKSSRSGLRIKVKGDKGEAMSSSGLAQDRAATSPSQVGGTLDAPADDGSVIMSPIVESPTRISPSNAIADVGPSKHTLSTSATVPNIPNSALLSAPADSDAVSVYSVGGTKKRKLFRRLSMKDSTPASPSTGSASTSGFTKSPKRKNTGLAGALAASGLAMANPIVSMPQITPAEIIARDQRSNTVTSHKSMASSDRARSPRSRQASLSYPASEYSDRDSFVSGIEGSDEDDDLDLDADDIPVTGFAVASARRNQEFHEMFPTVPEGDYLIEGVCFNTSLCRGSFAGAPRA
jgi:hypothetical protein